MDRYPVVPERILMIEKINVIFYFFFLFEMIVKLLGNGFKQYFRDGFNRFDCFLVLTTTLDLYLIYWFDVLDQDNLRNTYAAFRAIRLFRVFKLAKTWDRLNQLMEKIFMTIKSI